MKYGKITTEMTWQEVAEIEELKKKNKRMPVINQIFNINGTEHSYYKCPMCEEYVFDGDNYCRTCGQKLDMDTIAL